MDQPKIPTLKDSQKPQVKVRGLGGGLSLLDRMKQFKKKDLAFILAGLGTLCMAPLAEHFMMSPDNGGAGDLAGGPGGSGGSDKGIFGVDRGSGGGDGTAPGGPAGGGSDVITPLNVRDPSALIMGPGSAQQPAVGQMAQAAPPPTAPGGRSDSDVRDALAGSAIHAATSAVGKSLLPVPKIGLSGSSLRGLGVATGGSSASGGGGGLAAPSAANFGGRNVGTNMPGVKGGGNIAAIARGQNQGGTGLDGLKAAADNAAKGFNDGRNAAGTDLNNAAAQQIPSGGQGGGQGNGGSSAANKEVSGNSAKESKSTGESLAYQLMKENLEKQLALYWKEKEAADPYLEMMKLRNTALESITSSITGAIGTAFGNNIAGWLSGGAAGYICWQNGSSTGLNVSGAIPSSCAGNTTTPGTSGGSGTTGYPTVASNGGAGYILCNNGQATMTPVNCTAYGGGGTSSGAAPANPNSNVQAVNPPDGSSSPSVAGALAAQPQDGGNSGQ
jgi:hypothetical protein